MQNNFVKKFIIHQDIVREWDCPMRRFFLININNRTLKLSGKLILSLILTICLTENGLGTLVIRLTKADLVKKAHTILTGQVLTMRSEWNDDKTIIYSYIKVVVNEVIKGSLSDGIVVLKQPGGQVDDVVMKDIGSPQFSEGEDVVLFLIQVEDYFQVLGLAQGKFTVVRDIVGGRRVLMNDPSGITFLDMPNSNEKSIDFDNFINELKSLLKINENH